MMRKFYIALAAAVLSFSASAADMRLKPGLWEVTTKTDQAGMPQMPKLTPPQQAQMDKMGIKLPAGGGITIQTCLTKEQVERDELPKLREDARQKCEQTEFKRSGNTVNWKMVCTGERPMTGSGTMTMQSSEAYTSTMNIVGQDPKFGVINMSNSMQGKWLGATCPAKGPQP